MIRSLNDVTQFYPMKIYGFLFPHKFIYRSAVIVFEKDSVAEKYTKQRALLYVGKYQ